MKKLEKDYINLMPGEEKEPLRLPGKGVLAVVAFLLVWAGLFGMKFMEQRKLQVAQASLASQRQMLQRHLTDLQKELGLTSATGMDSDKASLIKNLLNERVLWSDVFKQFSRIVPRGMWFDSIEGAAATKTEIKIKGGAFNYSTVSEFMLAMEKTTLFARPQLLFAQKMVLQGREVVGFEIICGLKKAQGAQ